MKIAFAVFDLTMLRYYGPIIQHLKYDKNIEFIMGYHTENQKYNGLKNGVNFEKYKEIVQLLGPITSIPYSEEKIDCDLLFSIENFNKEYFSYEKHIVIQHGFDYIYGAPNTDSKSSYMCNSEMYGLDIQKRFNLEYCVPPLPVTLSNFNYQIEFAKKQIETTKDIAFILYPEVGHKRLVNSIIKYLRKKDFFIIIKQRKKNQKVPKRLGADLIIYDEIWYPSESIFYPLISKIVLGFGSSAYTDLAEAGINYVDNAVMEYATTSGYYLKPNLENFWYIEKDFVEESKLLIDKLFSEEINLKSVPLEKIKRFFIDLVKK